MRVLQVGRCLDLGQETLGTDDRSEFRLQHLERDLPLVPEIVGQVDRRHPSIDCTLTALYAAIVGNSLFVNPPGPVVCHLRYIIP